LKYDTTSLTSADYLPALVFGALQFIVRTAFGHGFNA